VHRPEVGAIERSMASPTPKRRRSAPAMNPGFRRRRYEIAELRGITGDSGVRPQPFEVFPREARLRVSPDRPSRSGFRTRDDLRRLDRYRCWASAAGLAFPPIDPRG
jgi:hypothetical protein